MNRALLLSGALGELAKAGKPIVLLPVTSNLVRHAMNDVHEQVSDETASYRCPGCDARFDAWRMNPTDDIALVGPVALFLHMLECRNYHDAVEPSTAEPF